MENLQTPKYWTLPEPTPKRPDLTGAPWVVEESIMQFRPARPLEARKMALFTNLDCTSFANLSKLDL